MSDSKSSPGLGPNRVVIILFAFLIEVAIAIVTVDAISFHAGRLTRSGIAYAESLSLVPGAALAGGLVLWTRAVRLDSMRLLALSIAVPAVISLGTAAVTFLGSTSVDVLIETPRTSESP